jgi:RimK family alpha-L-glutamate ligase
MVLIRKFHKKEKIMKITVLTSKIDLYSNRRFQEEAEAQSLAFEFLDPKRIFLDISSIEPILKEQSIVFHRTTGVGYDDIDLTISKLLEFQGNSVVNPPQILALLRSKADQAVLLNRLGLTALPSYILRGPLSEETVQVLENLSSDQQYILKMERGNSGIGVNLIRGKDALIGLLETFHGMRDQKFIIQPYISKAKEWRLFYINNELQIALERSSKEEDYRANFRHGNAKLIPNNKIPDSISRPCQKLAQNLNSLYFSIDLLETSEKVAILDVNLVPGLEQIEKFSPFNLTQKILNTVLTSCN